MFSSRILLGRTLIFTMLFLAGALLFTGCSLPWQHNTTAVANGTKPTAQQLLTALQKNFRGVSAFHVVMKVDNPGSVTAQQVQIRSANGDVVMPDKVKGQATVILSGQSVTVNLISVGGNQFITDPITGQWRVIKGLLDPRTLTNPDTGILSLVNKAQSVSQPAPFSGGETKVLSNSTIKVDQGSSRMFLFKPGVELEQIVRAVNEVGAAPGDLVAILEALREAGALQAELIVI